MSNELENTDTKTADVDSLDLSNEELKEIVDKFDPAPNLVFVGHRANPKFDETKAYHPESNPRLIRVDPPKSVTDGHATFELPEDQSQPFYHPEAHRIARAFPRLYKRFVKKGD